VGVDGLAREAPFVQQPWRHEVLQHAEHLKGKQADLDLGQAEQRVLGADRHVRHAQQAHATSHAGAVDAGDDGQLAMVRFAQQVGIVDVGP
jgi:hypothetical protein